MKYVLFVWYYDCPNGGWNDYHSIHSSIEDTREITRALPYFQKWQVVDISQNIVIEEGHNA